MSSQQEGGEKETEDDLFLSAKVFLGRFPDYTHDPGSGTILPALCSLRASNFEQTRDVFPYFADVKMARGVGRLAKVSESSIAVSEELRNKPGIVRGSQRDSAVIGLYDVGSGICKRLKGFVGLKASTCLGVTATDVPGESPRIVGSDYKKTALVWNSAGDSEAIAQLPDPPKHGLCATCVSEWDNEVFICGWGIQKSGDQDIRRYDMQKGGVLLQNYVGHTSEVWDISADPERSTLFSVSPEGKARMWARKSLGTKMLIELPKAGWGCCVAPDRHLFVAALSSGNISLFDIRNGSRLLRMFKAHEGTVCGRVIRTQYDRFVSTSSKAVSWNAEGKILMSTPKLRRTLDGVLAMGTRYDELKEHSSLALQETLERVLYLLDPASPFDMDVFQSAKVRVEGQQFSVVSFASVVLPSS